MIQSENQKQLTSQLYLLRNGERKKSLKLVELRATALTLRLHKIWRETIFWLVKEELAQNSTLKHTHNFCVYKHANIVCYTHTKILRTHTKATIHTQHW